MTASTGKAQQDTPMVSAKSDKDADAGRVVAPKAAAASSKLRASKECLGSMARILVHDTKPQVSSAGVEWADLCAQTPADGLALFLTACLQLAGLPMLTLRVQDLDNEPSAVLEAVPDWVRDRQVDTSQYALSKQSKFGAAHRATTNLQRFVESAIGCIQPRSLVESGLATSLAKWLEAFSKATLRSLRHVALVAACSLAGSIGKQVTALTNNQEVAYRQLESNRKGRQVSQLEAVIKEAEEVGLALDQIRAAILESVLPPRTRDVNEAVRLASLCEIEHLMVKDPDMFRQKKWTVRVFLMTHDPAAEVRMKAIALVEGWYADIDRHSEDIKEHLLIFAEQILPHLVQRAGDVDANVAAAAIKCLRLPVLAERLEDREFDDVVNLCPGSADLAVRKEAGYFINSHVFSEPGICAESGQAAAASATGPGKKRKLVKPDENAGEEDDATEAAKRARTGEDDEQAAGSAKETDISSVEALLQSETSISMLLAYLDDYMGDRLQLVERVVSAFWGSAPALSHWGIMVSLCIEGEHVEDGQVLSVQKRLALLYLLEACLRRCEEDFNGTKIQERTSAGAKLQEACSKVIPELPKLLEVCRPDRQHLRLMCQVCKRLLSHASVHCRRHAVSNVAALSKALRRSFEVASDSDCVKLCVDCLLVLADCSHEAKRHFMELAEEIYRSCIDLVSAENFQDQKDEARLVLNRLLMLANRGFDVTFDDAVLMQRFKDLLEVRIEWSSQVATSGKDTSQVAATPSQVPDARVALQLLEVLFVALTWQVRVLEWVKPDGAKKNAEGEQEPGAAAEKDAAPEGIEELGDLKDVKAAIPEKMNSLVSLCIRLIEKDCSPFVRYHAYNCYMLLLQLGISVGGEAEVTFPEDHVQVLFQYINDLFQRAYDLKEPTACLNLDGFAVDATSDDFADKIAGATTTSARMLLDCCIETTEETVRDRCEVGPEECMLFAVLAARVVAEHEHEKVHSGPLALLLLTQCEKSRPKALKEVACLLFRRLRNHARLSEDYAKQFWDVQLEAIQGTFLCCGLEAATSLCHAFTRQWGPQITIWLERPFYRALRDAVVAAITAEKDRLELLEVHILWMRNETIQAPFVRDILQHALRRCKALGINMQDGPVARFVNRCEGLLASAPHSSTPLQSGLEPEQQQQQLPQQSQHPSASSSSSSRGPARTHSDPPVAEEGSTRRPGGAAHTGGGGGPSTPQASSSSTIARPSPAASSSSGGAGAGVGPRSARSAQQRTPTSSVSRRKRELFSYAAAGAAEALRQLSGAAIASAAAATADEVEVVEVVED